MLFTNKPLLLSTLLALGAVHCSRGSAPPSNAPEAPAPESSMSGDPVTQGTSSASPTGMNAANTSDAAPENSGAQASMNLNDQQIAKVTETVHSAEIEQARLAQKKAESEQVRQYAAMMIEQHTQARQQQSALNLGMEASPLSERISTQSRATLNALNSKQGADFDQTYMQTQIAAHQQVLNAVQNELRPNAQNPQLQMYLQQLEPKLAMHLEHARQAQQSLQSSTTTDPSTGSSRSK